MSYPDQVNIGLDPPQQGNKRYIETPFIYLISTAVRQNMGIRVYSYLILYVIVATSFLWAKDFPPAYTFRKGREGGKGGKGL